MDKQKKEVEQIVRNLQNTWLENKITELASFFDKDVVFLIPGINKRIIGQEAMVESYKQFVSTCTIQNFQITNVDIDIFDRTAISTLTFNVSYKNQDKEYNEKGNDIMILNRKENNWLIIWRTQIPIEVSPDL